MFISVACEMFHYCFPSIVYVYIHVSLLEQALHICAKQNKAPILFAKMRGIDLSQAYTLSKNTTVHNAFDEIHVHMHSLCVHTVTTVIYVKAQNCEDIITPGLSCATSRR